jgi:hypothetical protein
MEAIKAGIKLTRYSKRNGEGGNAPLESTVAVINDFLPEIKSMSKILYTRSVN